MATRGFVLYLLSGFSVAVLSVLILSDVSGYSPNKNLLSSSSNSTLLQFSSHVSSSTDTIWPFFDAGIRVQLRLVLATVIGFLGSACGTVGGVGGGGIFVPMLTLIVSFDTNTAAALSKCMIMGASASSVWYNLRLSCPPHMWRLMGEANQTGHR